MMKIRFKKVMRYDDRSRVFRVFRLMWETDKKQIGHKLSLAFQPKFFELRRELWEWSIVLFGIRVHHVKGGGRFV